MKRKLVTSTFLIVLSITTCNSQIKSRQIEIINQYRECSLYKNALIGSAASHSFVFVLHKYLDLKDALIESDRQLTSAKALELSKSLKTINIANFSQEEHKIWVASLKSLSKNSKRIANSSNLKSQRIYFINLSKNIYNLQKVFATQIPIYYQFCPMANHGKGAAWLSQEKEIRNPYYGHQMLNCGIVQEIIN